jgi:E3 ubiquitin-protein ligase MYCBP2
MDPKIAPKANIDDFCSICFVKGLGQEPCVQIECGHIFHLECVKTKIQKQWNGPRIVFNYLDCSECKQRIAAPTCKPIREIIDKEQEFEKVVVKKAMERAKFEDLHKNERLKNPGDRFYNDLKALALYKLSYYQCFKCQEPYFGGMKDCEAAQQQAAEFKKEELVCGKCAAVSVGGGVKQCPKHGQDFIEFKCKFCCSLAQWFCWGTTHFCEPCHKKQCSGDYLSKKPLD